MREAANRSMIEHMDQDANGRVKPGASMSPGKTSKRRRRVRRGLRRRRRRGVVLRSISIVPTIFTLANALFGFAAIFVASRPADTELPAGWSPLTFACLFIYLGMLMDGLDGAVARLTHSYSDLGEQLDSMADMVTFGIAPAFAAVVLVGTQAPFGGGKGDTYFDRLALIMGMIYVVCAALRLARFNVELGGPDQPNRKTFKGLPSPGAAGTVVSMVLLHQHFLEHNAAAWITNAAAFAMIGITLLVAFAMVSKLRYTHVLNRYIRGRAPFETMVNVVILGLLALINLQLTLAAALVCYALSAPAVSLWKRLRKITP